MRILSALSWIAVASIAALAISLAQACPRIDVAALSSPAIPDAAFGWSIEEAISRLGGDVATSVDCR